MQHDLFGDNLAPPRRKAGLYVDVVFNRPLDHAYSYAVPKPMHDRVGVGKRVLAPFGRGEKATVGFCVRVSTTEPSLEVKDIQRVLDEEELLTGDLMRLTRWVADYYLCGWGQVLNAVVPFGVKQQAGTRIVTSLEAVPENELIHPVQGLTAKQSAALEKLRAAGKPVEWDRLRQVAQCGSMPLEALISKGFARSVTRRVDQFVSSPEEPVPAEAGVTLNPDQLRIWPVLEEALRQPKFHAFLLHGVTGSGKTEIYLRAIEEVIWQGKEALVLVPEISLTPQTIQRFQGRCGDVAVLHSHLANAERGGQWRRVARGEARVVVGARSAVFAPTRRLGLIVIDEEHEGSFKQENTPRYHARDVAVMRARLENIPIILGSATPSLESWHNVERQNYTLLSLPSRVLDRPLPPVVRIDMRHENLGRGRYHAISPSLERAMREALRDGGQVMLLLNRRGFNTHLHCPGCGAVETCRFCDLALTYHKQRDAAMCHYCGFEQEPPTRCGKCGRATVRYQGIGTEKLQAEIEQKFPHLVVRRMDSDSMRQRGSYTQVLSAFRQGLIHILLGTQMIAKGLDFPNVTLVGVVNADIGLHIPDFRSAERTFQLLSQVAGRAGRGPRGGKVLIQTFNPEQPCIALAADHDYRTFVGFEIGIRQAHNYPPFHRLIRLIVRSKDQSAAESFADRLAATLPKALEASQRPDSAGAGMRVLGPAEAPVFRLKGYYRYHFQLQSPSAALLHQVMRTLLDTIRTPAGVEFTVDVDPFNML
jgi:primosomal protein N' (replication factor Y)